MPRTGRPRGRPVGTGRLGETVRLTVRIPTELYQRLEAFAEGRTFTRSAPQLSECVRQALERYLDFPDKRQTRNVDISDEYNKSQTENKNTLDENNNRQTEKSVEAESTIPDSSALPVKPQRNNISRTINERTATETTLSAIPTEPENNKRQTENAVPAFDATKYTLGELCIHEHDYHGTGQSLRRLADRECLECHAARARAYRERKRQVQPA